jgi:hypothetical protein
MSNPSRSSDVRKSAFRIKGLPFGKSDDSSAKTKNKKNSPTLHDIVPQNKSPNPWKPVQPPVDRQELLTRLFVQRNEETSESINLDDYLDAPNSQALIQPSPDVEIIASPLPDSFKSNIQSLPTLDEEIAPRASSSEGDVEIPTTAPRPIEDALKASSDAGAKPTPFRMSFVIPRREKSSSTGSGLVSTTPRRRVDSNEASSKKPVDQVRLKETLPGEADEFLERSEEFPENPPETEKLQPETHKQTEKQKSRMVRRSVVSSAKQKNKSGWLAAAAKRSIDTELRPEVSTVRALKAIYCAAGGHVELNPDEPEIKVYKALRKISLVERYDYSKALFDDLSEYLSAYERKMVGNYLANAYSDQVISKNMRHTAGDLLSLRRFIEAQLLDLADKETKTPTSWARVSKSRADKAAKALGSARQIPVANEETINTEHGASDEESPIDKGPGTSDEESPTNN